MFTAYDARLEVLSGGKPLPASAKMPKEYSGVDRLFVMSPRGSVLKTERYNITAMAFTKAPLGGVELYTKAMGETVVGWAPPKKLVQVPGRSVWEISLPPSVRYKMHSFTGCPQWTCGTRQRRESGWKILGDISRKTPRAGGVHADLRMHALKAQSRSGERTWRLL